MGLAAPAAAAASARVSPGSAQLGPGAARKHHLALAGLPPEEPLPHRQHGWTDGASHARRGRGAATLLGMGLGEGTEGFIAGSMTLCTGEPSATLSCTKTTQASSPWPPRSPSVPLASDSGAVALGGSSALQGALPGTTRGLQQITARQQPLFPAQCRQERSHKRELFMAE